MFKKLLILIEQKLRTIVWEETQRASRHFENVHHDRTREIVMLILDLHDKKWSIQSDTFLRELNINPEKYWEKYSKK